MTSDAFASFCCQITRMRPPVLLTLLAAASPWLAAGSQLPKALLINLPRHPERFESVKVQLDSAGISYERAEAVDGKLLSPEELKANVTLAARWLITKGMIGCFLSHRACWKHCVEAADGPVLGAPPAG